MVFLCVGFLVNEIVDIIEVGRTFLSFLVFMDDVVYFCWCYEEDGVWVFEML